jgi:hypothetical protein
MSYHAPYKVGEIVPTQGYFTQKKYIKYAINNGGLRNIEQTVGFHSGRLKNGAYILELTRLPKPSEFEFAGYSQVASHRFQKTFPNIDTDLDIPAAKKSVIDMWNKEGGSSALVKIIPVTEHSKIMNDNNQYPPGLGIPQWKLTQPVNARITDLLTEY